MKTFDIGKELFHFSNERLCGSGLQNLYPRVKSLTEICNCNKNQYFCIKPSGKIVNSPEIFQFEG